MLWVRIHSKVKSNYELVGLEYQSPLLEGPYCCEPKPGLLHLLKSLCFLKVVRIVTIALPSGLSFSLIFR